MRSISKLLLKTQRESLKNKMDFNISRALDESVQQLYDQARTTTDQRLGHKKEISKTHRQQVFIAELTIALTRLFSKTDLLDPVKYDALSQSVRRWCPWEVERQTSSQLVRQLLISMLPEARKKQQLKKICSDYKADLTTEIETGLKSQYPKVYAEYTAQPPQMFGGPTLKTGLPTTLSFDSCQPMDRFLTETAPTLKNPDSSLQSAMTNYQAVRRLENTLENPIKPVTRQLQDFTSQFKVECPIIEKNPDSAAVQFIKRIVTTLSRGLLQRWGFWRVKGQEVSQQINQTLIKPAAAAPSSPVPTPGGSTN